MVDVPLFWFFISRCINSIMIPADSSFSKYFRQTIHFLINWVNKVKITRTVFRALLVNKFLTRVNIIKIICKNGKNSITIYFLLSTLLMLINVYFWYLVARIGMSFDNIFLKSKRHVLPTYDIDFSLLPKHLVMIEMKLRF